MARYKRAIFFQLRKDKMAKEWQIAKELREKQNKIIEELVVKVKKYENIMNTGKDEEIDGIFIYIY